MNQWSSTKLGCVHSHIHMAYFDEWRMFEFLGENRERRVDGRGAKMQPEAKVTYTFCSAPIP